MNQNLGEDICNIYNWQALESKIDKLLRWRPTRYFVKGHEQTLPGRSVYVKLHY